jgi:predicted ribosomally synthesized peptide with nif11-like leader
MSKENFFEFLTRAAGDDQLRERLHNVKTPDDLVKLAKDAGFEFSSTHVEDAISDLQQKSGFFQSLAESVLRVFGTSDDNYPEIGVQPFSGEPNQDS